MKLIDACFWMIKAGIALLAVIAVLALTAPTVVAMGEYMVGPRQLSCNDYSVKVPLRWEASMRRCDGEILLERRKHLFWDSESGQESLFVRSLVDRRTTPDHEETEFRNAYPVNSVASVRVSDAYTRCLRAPMERDGSRVSILCFDALNRMEFNYFGPEARVHEAASLIVLIH